MARSLRPVLLAALLLSLVPPAFGDTPALDSARAEFDDCEAQFIAFIGSDAYQFSPEHAGELGRVRLFSVLSYQRAAAARSWGQAFWRLRVRAAGARLPVYEARGTASIDDERGMALAEHFWDGRDQDGKVLPAGTYAYTFEARYLPAWLKAPAERYEDLAGVAGAEEAFASTDQVVLDHGLTRERALALRASAQATSCQVQQNAPLEAGFGYNFYYGSTHAHSNFSDGGQPTTACSSGNAYGSGNFTPADVYGYARNVAGLDYWVVNEHNHLINDSVATNNGPVTEAKVRQRYQDGRAAADAATVDDQFVGVYGMEWGVTTNADQGHLTLLETPVLFGWETCSTCNGPNPECSPGSNCYFDVFTPKRHGYLTLYQRSVQNPSPAGPLGIMAHPSTGEFDDYAFDANAEAALQGIAVRSGLAFNNTESCADANVGSTDYSARWRAALDKGFRLGPVADHDSHCNNFGQGIPTRTVYLLPNGSAPVLTKLALLQAHKARHFFASEDPNAQLVFRTGDGAHVMGDVFSAPGPVTLRAAVHDPNGDAVQTLELWRGQVGGGALTTPYQTFAGQSSVSVTENLASGSYYYFVHAVQADGHDLWSAPMWISYSGGGGCADTTPPAVAVTAPATGASLACADTVVRVSASDAAGIAAVEVQLDGGPWNAAAFDAGSGSYQYGWASSTATNGSHTITARATDASCGANVGNATPIAVTVDNTGCGGGGAAGLDIGGWRLTQANSTYNFTLPAGTTIPANGYVVVGRNATRAAFEAFWGVGLASNVVYLNAADALPVVNGSETFTLADAALSTQDGPTIAMSSGAGQSLRRNDPCLAAGATASWTVAASSTGNPGSGAGAGCGTGVVINEFSDALGTGNYVYEFVELHYDAPPAGDSQAPSASITAPAAGSTLSGTVAVSASATDNVGVTRVEFLLDGVLQASDTTSPYAWSWDTTTAGNGAHSLSSRAHDAAGNVGTSTAVAVTVGNVTGTDVSNWRLVQANSTLTYVLPAGTVIPANGYLVVGRNASRAAFEAFWGVGLASNVVYLNAADALPQVNGSENFTLYNAAGTKVDGKTYSMSSAAGQSLRRKDPCNAAGTSGSWTIGASSTANPGSGAGAGCGKGPVINEFSDATGTGNYVYEFVELHNDR